MVHVVQVDVGSGRTLLFEADAPSRVEADQAGERLRAPVNRGGQNPATERGRMDVQDVIASMKSASAELVQAIKAMELGPDGYELSFGIKVSTEVGAIIAKASGEANLTVKMSWTGLKAKGPASGGGDGG